MITTSPIRRGAPCRAETLPVAAYVTKNTRDAIDRAAAAEGLNRSTFARRALLRAIGAATATGAAQ